MTQPLNWQEHFGNVFFDLWKKAGLPDPLEFAEKYVELRFQAVFKHELIKETTEPNSVLQKTTVNSIYGFGVLHGRMFAQLLGINELEIPDAIDWCGRFNLGISTFDYITDETPDGIAKFTSFEVFQSLKSQESQLKQQLNPTEVFLMQLSQGVLKDIENMDLVNGTNHLMLSMKQLYNSQMFLSKASLKNMPDPDRIGKFLYLKSAEPFLVMAEYIANASHLGQEKIEIAKSLGKAFGKLYWLIDDAIDVWIDLEANDWNLFLLMAFNQNPKLFTEQSNISIKKDLEKIWYEDSVAERLSNKMIEELKNTIKDLEASEEEITEQLGIMASVLWHWYKF